MHQNVGNFRIFFGGRKNWRVRALYTNCARNYDVCYISVSLPVQAVARAPHSRYRLKVLKIDIFSGTRSKNRHEQKNVDTRALFRPKTLNNKIYFICFFLFVWAVSRAPLKSQFWAVFEKCTKMSEISGFFSEVEKIEGFGHYIQTVCKIMMYVTYLCHFRSRLWLERPAVGIGWRC